MEFIEAKINPNSTLKNALKKVKESSPKNEGKSRIKRPKSRNRTDAPAQTVPGGMVVPPSTARPCQISGRPVVLGLGARSVSCHVFLRFALLGARGFLDPLIFLEITFEVLFSIKIR